MSKLLLFALIAVAVYWLLRARRSRRPPLRRPGSAETMVSCAYCGLHIPRGESLAAEGRHYCGEEHRRLDADVRKG